MLQGYYCDDSEAMFENTDNSPAFNDWVEYESAKKLHAENERLTKILVSYHIQFQAAMRAQSLGLCKRVIKHALEDEQAINSKEKP